MVGSKATSLLGVVVGSKATSLGVVVGSKATSLLGVVVGSKATSLLGVVVGSKATSLLGVVVEGAGGDEADTPVLSLVVGGVDDEATGVLSAETGEGSEADLSGGGGRGRGRGAPVRRDTRVDLPTRGGPYIIACNMVMSNFFFARITPSKTVRWRISSAAEDGKISSQYNNKYLQIHTLIGGGDDGTFYYILAWLVC